MSKLHRLSSGYDGFVCCHHARIDLCHTHRAVHRKLGVHCKHEGNPVRVEWVDMMQKTPISSTHVTDASAEKVGEYALEETQSQLLPGSNSSQKEARN